MFNYLDCAVFDTAAFCFKSSLIKFFVLTLFLSKGKQNKTKNEKKEKKWREVLKEESERNMK